MVTERETEGRNVQEQSSRLQTELNRLRQELQDKVSQEETLRQQMTEKEEKTRKAFVIAKQKINQLIGGRMSLMDLWVFGYSFARNIESGGRSRFT